MRRLNMNNIVEHVPGDIIKYVKELGLDPSLDGFGWICYVIDYMAHCPVNQGMSVSQMYADLACHGGKDCTGSTVERSIRHAIKKLYSDKTPDQLPKVRYSRMKNSPTNSQFFADIYSDYILNI